MNCPHLVICAGDSLFKSFFSAPQRKRLSTLYSTRRFGSATLTPALKRFLSDADAMITTWDSPPFTEDLPLIAPRLRIVAHCGGEVKARFARSLFAQLTITNAAGPMARATAEMGAAFLLYCARNVDVYRAELRKPSNEIYQRLHASGSTDETIVGREISMIGFGRIGRALVDLLRGFDLRWHVHDPYASPETAKDYPVQFGTLEDVLRKSAFVVLTAALTDETRGIMNRQTLSLLRDGAVLINIARGGLIDLDALTAEVRRGRLRCALDVTDPLEPLPLRHPLRKLPGAILTPHVAGSPREVRRAMADVVLDDLDRFFRNEPVGNRVTTAMLDRMT